MSRTADQLVQGALDLHAHGSPEFTNALPGRVSNVEWARLAVQAGMRGFVIKSHVFPTIGAANALAALYPELSVFASITLNPPVGGLSATTVEFAIQGGARMVWLPTWSARQDSPKHSIFLERMQPYIRGLDPDFWPTQGLSVLDDSGALLPEVDRILQLCGQHGVAVASGHIPVRASLVICRRARELGVNFVLTHPLSGSVGASLDDQRAIAAMGGTIEHVFIGCMPMHQRMDPRRIVEAIEAVGAQHCILSTDAIENWNPPEPEVLRMFIATLLALGVAGDDIHLMTHDNPARVLGLDPAWQPGDEEKAAPRP